MKDVYEDVQLIAVLVIGACGVAFVIGVAAGLFRLGYGLAGG